MNRQTDLFPDLKERHDGERAVVVLSGGADSTICLHYALAQGYDVHAVTFDYGQRHKLEVIAACTIARIAGVTHEVVYLGNEVLKGTSPLISDAPLDQYADADSLPGGLEKTFVPMRNQLFLTLAANRAYVLGARTLFTGVCEADFGGYPDCRRGFIELFEQVSSAGTFTDRYLIVRTPLMYLTKADSVRLALELDGCYEALAFSHTAYDGVYPPTGHDHASLLRAKGFAEAGVPDPLVLRAWIESLDLELPDSAEYSTETIRGNYLLRVARALHAEHERTRGEITVKLDVSINGEDC